MCQIHYSYSPSLRSSWQTTCQHSILDIPNYTGHARITDISRPSSRAKCDDAQTVSTSYLAVNQLRPLLPFSWVTASSCRCGIWLCSRPSSLNDKENLNTPRTMQIHAFSIHYEHVRRELTPSVRTKAG